MITELVDAELRAEAPAVLKCAFHERGMGTATAQPQIGADALGLPVDAIRIEYGDSALPAGAVAGASAQTASTADSMTDVCEKLIKKIHDLARRAPGSP